MNYRLQDPAAGGFTTVNPKVLLQGAYDPVTGLMRDDLRQLGLIPLTEPYGNHGESVDPAVLLQVGPQAIVDWVTVELRSAADPTQVIAIRSALLTRSGQIVDVDGSSPVLFGGIQPDQFHLAIRR